MKTTTMLSSVGPLLFVFVLIMPLMHAQSANTTTTPQTNTTYNTTATVPPTAAPSVSISASASSLTAGLPETLTATIIGGTPPYMYNFYNVTSGAVMTACSAIASNSTTTTCTFNTGATGTFSYLVIVTDNAPNSTLFDSLPPISINVTAAPATASTAVVVTGGAGSPPLVPTPVNSSTTIAAPITHYPIASSTVQTTTISPPTTTVAVTTSPTTTTTPIQQSAAAGNALSTRAYEALAVLVVIAALVAVFYALNRTKRKRR